MAIQKSFPIISKLTDAQKGIFFECFGKPESTAYNITFGIRIPKSIDPDLFVEAVKKVVYNHPTFFVRIEIMDNDPVMILDKDNMECDVVRCQKSDYETAARECIQPFDLIGGPLVRFKMCRINEEYVFFCNIHHIISDGTSMKVFLQQICDVYEGKEIPAEEISYFDVASMEEQLKTTKEYSDALNYYGQKFENVEYDDTIPYDLDPSKTKICRKMLSVYSDTVIDSDEIEEFTRNNDITKSTLFMGAFAYTQALFSGDKNSCFTTATVGRNDKRLMNTQGMFVKILPLHFEINDEEKSVSFLKNIRKDFINLKDNNIVFFQDLVEKFGIRNNVSFTYQSDILSEIEFGGSYIIPEELLQNEAQADILCMVLKLQDRYEIRLHYRGECYSEQYIKSFGDTMFAVITGLLKCEYLKDIRLVTPETERIFNSVNSTERPFAANETINSVFNENVIRYADKVALLYKERKYTYSEVDRVTKRISGYINSMGIGIEDYVSVLTPRDDTGVFAAWGVIRSGAGFQMLDPSYPMERLNYMVRDCQAKLLIVDRALRDMLNEYEGPVLFTDEFDKLPDSDKLFEDKPEGAFCLIYTSGTTGNPKGCVLENRNLVAFCESHSKTMEMDSTSRIGSYASFGFDAGVMDFVTAFFIGGSLCIIPDEIRLDVFKVEECFCKNEITHGFMTTQVGSMFVRQTKCKSLKYFVVGGEKYVPFTPPEGFSFLNGYGPCETMGYVCCIKVVEENSITPIGKPVYNTKLFVMDKYERLLPAGAVGEMCISGLQVGRGYLGLPEKTAEVFVHNPFSDKPGYERMYRTGDMVRLLPDGNFDFIGRKDSQVKIRGYRVELTEIEEVIHRFEGIKDVTVNALTDANGGKYLVAYVVSDDKVDIEKLHAFIRNEKPLYMVPSVTMQIDAVPYNHNHKVNKKALPVPSGKTDNAVIDKPTNDVEKQIHDIVCTLLGNSGIGINTDIFEAGMTSIGLLRFTIMLGEQFSKAVNISDIKECATVKKIASFIQNSDECTKYEKQPDYPLMQNQMGVFIESQMSGPSVKYNIPMLIKIDDSLDVERLKEAVEKALDAHPYIHSVIVNNEGNIRVKRTESSSRVEVIRVPSLPGTDELIRPFTLFGEELYRVQIYDTREGKYLFMDFHHIISDGTSIGILINDINSSYAGEILKEESYSEFEASYDEALRRKSGENEESEKYYEKLLEGVNTDCLPGKCPKDEAGDGEKADYEYSFGSNSKAIIDYCQKSNVSINAFLNAVFGYVLSEFIHNEDVSYCTIYNGRNDSRIAGAFGMFVRTIPVKINVDYGLKVSEYIAKVQKMLVDTMSYDVPFASLSEKYGLKSDIFFNYQGDEFEFNSIGGFDATLVKVELKEAKAPLSVEVYLKNGEFTASVTSRLDYFRKEFVDILMDSLITAAGSFAQSSLLSEVKIISEDEKKISYDVMNQTAQPFEEVPAHIFIERTAKANPDKTAVRTASSSLTFGELNSRADSVASSLISMGIRADEIVGLILNRDENVPVAEIGIMKSGGAFLAMLPTYPDDRIDFCLRDAGCRFVIATKDIISSHGDLFAESKPYKVLALEDLLDGDKELPAVSFDMSQLAYCIYTSGSTGTPKGVMIEQHNLTDFVQTASLRKVEEQGSTILCMASISFDMSITEMFFSLCCGNTIYIATEEEIHNLDLLLKAFIENKVDIMMMTPSFAWSLLSIPEFEKAITGLKGIVLGAEAFRPNLFEKLRSLNPDMVIQNGYGPTECTQVCSVKTLSDSRNITIGSPFANTQFYVIDKNLNLLPRYAYGELLICGEGVCRGYVNLPDKTAESFISYNNVRGYRSGDLVRINADNEVEFVGRSDNQVKLRGFRIELDEIEAVMQEFEGITMAKVIVRNNGYEDYLAGFFTSDSKIDIEELSTFLKLKLTYYMVPAALMQLETMPLTANGKLDKRALPEIEPVKKDRIKREPSGKTEAHILEIIKEVLSIDECYPDDNFFEIGGTSLSASKVVMMLKAEGYPLEYQDIFDHQSAAGLADYVGDVTREEKPENNASDTFDETRTAPKYAELLKYNTLEYAKEVTRQSLGTVLLTGAAGFLGAHILNALLEYEEGNIVCILRKGSHDDVLTRLRATLIYYFEDDFEEAFKNRITVLEGDITDDTLIDMFKDIHIDTIINCAASVKHYANDNSIEFVNVHGVEQLIGLAKAQNAKLIQISTSSVPGAHTPETYMRNIKMHENELFVIDDLNNQYGQSKHKAEIKVLDAISEGMRGKIIRVGNLMGRHSDGEFQTNMHTNSFLNGLRGFVNIGKCPISHATDPMSFSPVDCTAKAVVYLAGTNDMFTAFHAESRSTFDEMKIFEAINRCGIEVKPVSDEEYYSDFYAFMKDPSKNEKVSALLTNDRPDMHMVEADNRFTANILYRLGFSWPFIDDEYLEKVISSLDSLDFFFMD